MFGKQKGKQQDLLRGLIGPEAARRKGQATQVPNGTTSSKVGGPQLIGGQRSPLLRPRKKRTNSLLGGG
jgi:hypothetical protein